MQFFSSSFTSSCQFLCKVILAYSAGRDSLKEEDFPGHFFPLQERNEQREKCGNHHHHHSTVLHGESLEITCQERADILFSPTFPLARSNWTFLPRRVKQVFFLLSYQAASAQFRIYWFSIKGDPPGNNERMEGGWLYPLFFFSQTGKRK